MKTKLIAAALALSSFAMFGSPAVAQEDAYAQGFLAYEKANYVEALRFFRLAAEQGNASAQFELGNMHQFGEGVPQNYAEAAKWFRLAAEQGHTEAQLYLGNLHQNGLGVPKNDAEAVKWYRLAAEQGNASAQHELGKSQE
jgi:TPR repeat protein